MDREWKGRDRKPFERTTQALALNVKNTTSTPRS